MNIKKYIIALSFVAFSFFSSIPLVNASCSLQSLKECDRAGLISVLTELIKYKQLNNKADLVKFKATEIVSNNLPESIEFWTQAYCPGSGTRYDYIYNMPGYILKSCEKGNDGSHGGCKTCIMSNIKFVKGSLEESFFDAIKNRNIEMIKDLIELGVDINTKDKNGKSSLSYAFESNDFSLVDFFKSSGLVMSSSEDSKYREMKIKKLMIDVGNIIEENENKDDEYWMERDPVVQNVVKDINKLSNSSSLVIHSYAYNSWCYKVPLGSDKEGWCIDSSGEFEELVNGGCEKNYASCVDINSRIEKGNDSKANIELMINGDKSFIVLKKIDERDGLRYKLFRREKNDINWILVGDTAKAEVVNNLEELDSKVFIYKIFAFDKNNRIVWSSYSSSIDLAEYRRQSKVSFCEEYVKSTRMDEFLGRATLKGFLKLEKGDLLGKEVIFANFVSDDMGDIKNYLGTNSSDVSLGCYNKNEKNIEGFDYFDSKSVRNIIDGENLNKLLSSSKNKKVEISFYKGVPEPHRGLALDICSIRFVGIKVLD